MKPGLLAAHAKCDPARCAVDSTPQFARVFSVHLAKDRAASVTSCCRHLAEPGPEFSAVGTEHRDLCFWGISDRANDWTAPQSGSSIGVVISRAQHKIAEVFTVSGLVADMGGPAMLQGVHALDIGASPGGWTYYLAAACARVVAVDPGALADQVASAPNVHHVRAKLPLALRTEAPTDLGCDQTPSAGINRGEHVGTRATGRPDAVAEIKSFAPAGGYALAVCDINASPAEVRLFSLPL